MSAAAHAVLSVASGGVVGLTLGLFGGGGSILAVQLMVYVVGVPDAHVAVGTSAMAVAANAATGLWEHARHGLVLWRSATLYSVAGTGGALVGSTFGKAVDGRHLLALFAVLMLVVAALMARSHPGRAAVHEGNAPRLAGYGAATGALSGFFGIGGGFLIVPGLVASTGMPIINAIGFSLLAVIAFGLPTALGYAASGLVDWPLAALFVLGGTGGGRPGCLIARRCAQRRDALRPMLAILICVAATYTLARSL